MFKSVDIFEARKEGYKTYRVPGITVSKNNIVLATAEARPSMGDDWDFNDIIMRRSLDEGDTFGERKFIANHKDIGDGPISNFVMIPDMNSGRIIAVYCWKYSRVFKIYSDDDGATFSEPQEITETFNKFHDDYDWKVCATGPGHGIQLSNGRMIIPVWLSDGSGTEMGKGNLGHRPSIITSIHSDDNGLSWERGDIVCRHNDNIDDNILINPSETIPVQLNDGSVMLNIRSESEIDRRLIAVSPDGSTNWTIRGFDNALLEPVCMASIIKSNQLNDKDTNDILFINPDNLENITHPLGHLNENDRKRLTVKLSLDDAKTWPISKVIEEGPSGYSDVAQLASGDFLCIYECEIIERRCDDKYIRVSKFSKNWLKE